jgi:hypothetical protein
LQATGVFAQAAEHPRGFGPAGEFGELAQHQQREDDEERKLPGARLASGKPPDHPGDHRRENQKADDLADGLPQAIRIQRSPGPQSEAQAQSGNNAPGDPGGFGQLKPRRRRQGSRLDDRWGGGVHGVMRK